MKTIRLSAAQSELVRLALIAYRNAQPDNPAGRESKRVCKLILKDIDTYEGAALANDLWIDEYQWPVISRALRPLGSNPPSGSHAAKLYALYTRLRNEFPTHRAVRYNPKTKTYPGGRAGN